MTASVGELATGCLEADHRSLDATLLEAANAARAGSFSEARAKFYAFASGLERHIDAEESELFPEIEQIEPRARGPTTVMRAEHEEMRGMLQRIDSELTAESASWAASMRRLDELLAAHNMKEERVLYPMADAATERAGRSGPLAERLRRALAREPSGSA